MPGWLYKADTTTGADFARFRALLSRHGASVSLVETGQNLAVEDNARLIEDRIRHAGRSGKAIVVVSGSKGGPEVALALSNLRQDPDARQVKAWLNIGGLMAGTPLADTALTWPTCWFVYLAVLPDSSFDGIRSVSTARSTARRKDLELPADVLVVNYVAVPLSGDISRQASEGYRRLRADGPNDGLTYLPDAIVPDSVTIPEIGVDHYFRAANIDLRAIALTRAIVRHAKNTPMAQHDVSYRRVRTSNGEHGLAVGELYRGIRGGMPLTPNR